MWTSAEYQIKVKKLNGPGGVRRFRFRCQRIAEDPAKRWHVMPQQLGAMSDATMVALANAGIAAIACGSGGTDAAAGQLPVRRGRHQGKQAPAR